MVKQKAPNAAWTHCFVHREALASKKLSPELNAVMADVVKAVNYVKTRPLKARFFAKLCEEMGSQYTYLLFYCETRWLSRGNVLERVFSLREELKDFFEQEDVDIGDCFGKEDSLFRIAYLCDVFSHLNMLNLQLQGNKKFYHDLVDKLIFSVVICN